MQPPQYAELVVGGRFNGPRVSANGGYAAGALAAFVPAATVEVTLRVPPPLDATMLVSLPGERAGEEDGARARLMHDGTLVAEAVARPDDVLDPLSPVGVEEARTAATRYPGLRDHPFPTCFGCGPERAEGDGLRIFPGASGDGQVAAPWTPHPSLLVDGVLPPAVVWTALDCTGGWAVETDEGTGLGERPMVLGRMTARIDAVPQVGEPHVVVGRHLGSDGRKATTASTLYDEDRRIVAQARHVWIQVDPAFFNGPA